MRTDPLYGILLELQAERQRQDELHGFQPDLPHGCGHHYAIEWLEEIRKAAAEREALGSLTFRDVLLEEVYEVLAEPDDALRRKELLQVAALCVKEVQRMDLRGKANG